VQTRNVTLAISAKAHHKARLWAAQYDVSLSAVISALLEGLPDNPNGPRAVEHIRQQNSNPKATPAPTAELTPPPSNPVKL
jgi:hypothetical protein